MKKIKLTRGQSVMVDDEDYNRMNKWEWFAEKQHDRYYASRVFLIGGLRIKVKMANLIMDVPKGKICNYIDTNRLNLQKSNLRVCTQAQNLQNQQVQHKCKSSIFKGVSYLKGRNRWQAYIKVNGKDVHLGTFKIEMNAALAYDDASRKYYGEFARPNFK